MAILQKLVSFLELTIMEYSAAQPGTKPSNLVFEDFDHNLANAEFNRVPQKAYSTI